MVCELVRVSEALWRGKAGQHPQVFTPVKINHCSYCDRRIQYNQPAAGGCLVPLELVLSRELCVGL